MEAFPDVNWELARPNITMWAADLSDAPSTKDLAAARDLIYDLSKRIDIMTRPPIEDEAFVTSEREDDIEAPAEEEEEEEEEVEVEAPKALPKVKATPKSKAASKPELIKNEVMVSRKFSSFIR
jgi:hypothetical protein